MLIVGYTQCYVQAHYAQCHYGEFHYAECLCSTFGSALYLFLFTRLNSWSAVVAQWIEHSMTDPNTEGSSLPSGHNEKMIKKNEYFKFIYPYFFSGTLRVLAPSPLQQTLSFPASERPHVFGGSCPRKSEKQC